MYKQVVNVTTNTDKIFMQRCIELAKNGSLYTKPNPMVGCVIVHDGQIIGEGYHNKYGEAHAEVNAINAVENKDLLKESTLYVNLEPCSHFGKTPPCADLIIEKKIPRVVIGNIDPHEKVSGKGIEKLEKAGCSVSSGILEDECWELNKMFFTFHTKKRPYIILKWAESADGFIDKIRNENDPIGPNWITNEKSRQLVHKWRAECQAIMVGANTIKKDNPLLNVRAWPGNNPLRVIIDKYADIPATSAVFNKEIQTLVFTKKASQTKHGLEYIHIEENRHILDFVLNILFERNITSLFVEGGTRLIENFMEHNYWDEARVFRGSVRFDKGIEAPLPNHALRYCNTVFGTQLINIYPKSNI